MNVGRRFIGQVWGLAVVNCALMGGVAQADVFNLGGTRNADGSWNGTASLETVPVGNPGNVKDSTGYGQVNYSYNIGKYEVTAGQYTEFLNAVAATDTYTLYNSSMADTAFGSGITRSGSPGSYEYTVDPAFVNRPVNYVSFWDACRFANWLNNGQGGASTTEYGAYAFNGIANPPSASITRSTTANWAVTSEDEWYKAAYYNPAASNYYLYPTSSNTVPGNDMADPLGNDANYYTGSGSYPIDSGKYTTVAGEFQNSASPYGTFDQGGNVYEWNEGLRGSIRGGRGGAFDFTDSYMQSGSTNGGSRNAEYEFTGFRVVQLVPEPTSLALLGMGVIGMVIRRRGAAK